MPKLYRNLQKIPLKGLGDLSHFRLAHVWFIHSRISFSDKKIKEDTI